MDQNQQDFINALAQINESVDIVVWPWQESSDSFYQQKNLINYLSDDSLNINERSAKEDILLITKNFDKNLFIMTFEYVEGLAENKIKNHFKNIEGLRKNKDKNQDILNIAYIASDFLNTNFENTLKKIIAQKSKINLIEVKL